MRGRKRLECRRAQQQRFRVDEATQVVVSMGGGRTQLRIIDDRAVAAQPRSLDKGISDGTRVGVGCCDSKHISHAAAIGHGGEEGGER